MMPQEIDPKTARIAASKKKEMEAKYEEELEDLRAELLAKDSELTKMAAEKDWLTSRLHDSQKELDELRTNLCDALKLARKQDEEDGKKHGGNDGLTLVQRLASSGWWANYLSIHLCIKTNSSYPPCEGKSRLQLEGEKRHKARQLLKVSQSNCSLCFQVN